MNALTRIASQIDRPQPAEVAAATLAELRSTLASIGIKGVAESMQSDERAIDLAAWQVVVLMFRQMAPSVRGAEWVQLIDAIEAAWNADTPEDRAEHLHDAVNTIEGLL